MQRLLEDNIAIMPCCKHVLPHRVRAGIGSIVAGNALTPYLGAPEDIAHAIAFLAARETRRLTDTP